MGDLSAEPSMEDILASIKRVIKEGDAPATARRPAPRPLGGHDRDAVLELNEPLAEPEPYAPVEPAGFDDDYAIAAPPPPPPPVPPVTPTPAPAVSAPVAEEHDEAPAASAATVEAARGALGALSRLIVKPDPDGDGTLEGLVREMLRPMLGEWLDQNLPRLVEQMVAREIAKITAGQA